MDKDSEIVTPELGNVVEKGKNDIGFNQVEELTINENNNSNNVIDNNLSTYYCQNCKTIYTSSSASAGISCVICRNTGLIKDDNFEYMSPTYVIPFVKSSEDVIKKYKRYIGINPFLPSCFKCKEVASKIRKVYLPCTLYDLNVSGKISFICCDSVDKKTNKPIQSYDVSYTANFDYNGLLLSDCNSFNGKMFSSINNYDLGNSLVLGEKSLDVYYIKPDYSIDSIKNQLIKKAVNTVKGEVDYKLKKIKDNNINCNVVSEKKFLLPVYLLKINYNDIDYYYLMNGQTGKSSIDLAISIPKVVIVSIIIFIVVFAIMILIAYML